MWKSNKDIDLLVTKVTKGDENAFEKLFRIYYARLHKYANYFINDLDEAEDLVQEVFVQIWNNRSRIDNQQKFSSYIFKLVKNRCLNNLKHKIVEGKYVDKQLADSTEELYHISFEMDEGFKSVDELLSAELEKLMDKMPDRCSECFRLKWIEGKTIKEIAATMQISTTMVDKHLAKGLNIARTNLDPEMFLFLILHKG